MITALVFILVLFSFALVIGVPVALATPEEWENSKSSIFNLASAWCLLVIVTGIVASA